MGADLVRLSAACQMISNLVDAASILRPHLLRALPGSRTPVIERCAVDDDDDSEAMVGGDALRLLYAHGLFVASRAWYADIHSLWRVET